MMMAAGLASISAGYEQSPRSLHTEIVRGVKNISKRSRDEK